MSVYHGRSDKTRHEVREEEGRREMEAPTVTGVASATGDGGLSALLSTEFLICPSGNKVRLIAHLMLSIAFFYCYSSKHLLLGFAYSCQVVAGSSFNLILLLFVRDSFPVVSIKQRNSTKAIYCFFSC